jgi:replication factor A3
MKMRSPNHTSTDYNLANTVVEISHQHRSLFAYD